MYLISSPWNRVSAVPDPSRLSTVPGRWFTAILIGILASLGGSPVYAQPAAKPAPPRGDFTVETVREGLDGFELRVLVPEPTVEEFRLEDDRVFTRVSLPGFGSTAAAGQPDLPMRGIPFALPAGVRAELSVDVLTTSEFRGGMPLPVPGREVIDGEPFAVPVEDFEADATLYASAGPFPAQVAALSPEAGWRFHRVQSVNLHPVQVSPRSGTYTVARELRIRVRFVSDGAASAAGSRVAAGSDRPEWEQAADRLLVNSRTARLFRTRPTPVPLGVTGVSAGETRIRVRVGGSGIARIPYATLAEAGYPTEVPVAQVMVEERGYAGTAPDPFTSVNLPRRVEDANANGILDAGDTVLFAVFNYEDRFKLGFADNRYSYFHTYWLTTGEGVDFPVRDGFPGEGQWEPVPSFPHRVVNEENEEYINFPDDSSGNFLPQRTTLYWLGPFFTDADKTFGFEVPDPAPGGTTRLFASWQGAFVAGNQSIHRVSLDINTTRVLLARQFIGTQTLDWDSGPLATDGLLQPGANTFTVIGRGITDNTKGSGAYFDRLDVTYDRRLVARGNALRFNSGTRQGNLEFVVEGFTRSDLWLLDVTDPQAPVRITPRIEGSGNSFTLRFRDVAGATRREYAAFAPELLNGLPPSRHALPPDLAESGFIGRGLSRDLIAEGEGSDYILVVHPSTREAWQPLVDLRESQGHRVLLCDVWEIYDQFAGGDKTPWAIQRFLARAFNTWTEPPSYLVLGGDASEDYRTDIPLADPDWVPTLMHLANVPGALRIRELAGSDTWYASFLPQGQPTYDVVPDMFVGRLPVGSLQQARDVVTKIVEYEQHDPAGTWRNRGVFLADDQYSTSITGTSTYCWKSAEGVFKDTVEDVADSIATTGHLPDFDSRVFLLSDALDNAPQTWRNPGPGDCPVDSSSATLPAATTATATYTRREVTPGFLATLNEGGLIWAFTGHANKNTITTETLFIHNEQFIGSDQRDVDRLVNFGKPFIFMGYACHLAEFEYAREGNVGESIGEALLLAPNRGSVASFASTGYEWLHTNRDAQLATTSPLFWQLPRDEETGRPRRILGEATTIGLIDLAARRGFVQDFAEMLRTYQLLGDPALKVDITPPVFRVNLNGESVETGTPLRAASFSDSLLVEATVFDDTNLEDIEVYEGETRLTTARLNLEVPPFGADGGKTATLSFKTAIRLADYDVEIRTREWFGREVRFTLPVRFETRFLVGDRILDPTAENLLDSLAVIQVEVRSPVPLEEGALEVFADGSSLGLTPVEVADEGRFWTFRTTNIWGGGPHTLRTVISGAGESLARELSFTVPTDEVALASAYFYPNPYARGPAHFAYRLTNRAEDVDLAVYTVRGRRVLHSRIEGDPGWNYFQWNLRDDAGDEVANGVYLFVLKVRGAGGEDIRHIEKVAVAR